MKFKWWLSWQTLEVHLWIILNQAFLSSWMFYDPSNSKILQWRKLQKKRNWLTGPYFCLYIIDNFLHLLCLAPRAQFLPVLQDSGPVKPLSLPFQSLCMFLFLHWAKASLLRCCVNTLSLCTALSPAMPSCPEGQWLLQGGLVCPALCAQGLWSAPGWAQGAALGDTQLWWLWVTPMLLCAHSMQEWSSGSPSQQLS